MAGTGDGYEVRLQLFAPLDTPEPILHNLQAMPSFLILCTKVQNALFDNVELYHWKSNCFMDDSIWSKENHQLAT